MSLPTVVRAEGMIYPAAIGAGVAYSMYGSDTVPLAVGAVAGYFGYPLVGQFGAGLPLPPLLAMSVPEIVAGGVIGYNLYGGSIAYTLGGAAAGIAVKAAMGYLIYKEIGSPKIL